MHVRKFTVYWRDGRKELLSGIDHADALNKAGYGRGAIAAIDFIGNGEDNSYVWIQDPVTKKNTWAAKRWLFTIYWKDGRMQILRGLTYAGALKGANLDQDPDLPKKMAFFTNGHIPDRFTYDEKTHSWMKTATMRRAS